VPPKQITLQALEQLRRTSPKRRRFSDNPTVCKLDDGTCSVSFVFSSVNRLFRRDTQIRTVDGRYSHYLRLSDPKVISVALKWHDRHRRFIFLRDLLDFSVALDFNFAKRRVYTELGLAEYNAKSVRHGPSIEALVRACVRAITDISLYRESDAICAVPPSPEKEWDLPTQIAQLVSARIGKPDLSPLVQFREIKKSITATPLAEKWNALDAAGLTIDQRIGGNKLILIDDKYQSGTTAHFVASKLYEAGAVEVNGLFCIKTWRDTDNQ